MTCLYMTLGLVSLPLYDGARLSVLEAVAKSFCWFSEHSGVSKEALSSGLLLQHKTLPPHNRLPQTYAAAHKVIEPFFIDSIQFHVCPNDCIVFQGHYTDLQHCSLCSASRYVTPDVPAKRYLPIGPQLERLCATANLAQIIHSIRMEIVRVRCVMFTIHLYGEMPTALRFFLEETLEESPSHYEPITGYHSMWPIVLTILNLPPKIRSLFFWLELYREITRSGRTHLIHTLKF